MSGPFSGNGLFGAKAEELSDRAFAAIEDLGERMEAVRREVANIELEEAWETTFSIVGNGRANGANVTEVEVGPGLGEQWIIDHIGISTSDEAAAFDVGLFLGDSPIGMVTTVVEAGIGNLGGLTHRIPTIYTGSSISARFPAAVANGSTCTLHVIGRRVGGGD